ncbi:MAG TPA: GPP34 family phosphoprotein [Dehalococcoidia bacterium]|nr:GPP34 family phosphoprotein [Dehalococcoidia bacterium]
MTKPDLAAPVPDANRLTLAHELLLLALAAPAAGLRDHTLDRAVAGGLLGELALRGLVRLTPAALQLSPIALDALPHLRATVPALALTLEQLLATREPYAPAEWVAVLALRGSELRQILLHELGAARLVEAASASSVAGRPAAAQPSALIDAAPLRLAREQLRAVVLHGVQATARDRLQLSLLCGCGLEGVFLQADERRRVRPRLIQLTRHEPIGEAVRRPHRPRMHVAGQERFPEARLSDLLAWLGLPAGLVERLAFFWRG